MSDPTSRYYQIGRTIRTDADGHRTVYLKRRMLPAPESLPIMTAVTVTQETRLDLIAARLQGNPLLSWRIADANEALNPFDLTAVQGRVLRVPKPGGATG